MNNYAFLKWLFQKRLLRKGYNAWQNFLNNKHVSEYTTFAGVVVTCGRRVRYLRKVKTYRKLRSLLSGDRYFREVVAAGVGGAFVGPPWQNSR